MKLFRYAPRMSLPRKELEKGRVCGKIDDMEYAGLRKMGKEGLRLETVLKPSK